MESEIHSQSLSNLRSYNPKNFKSDAQSKVLFDSRHKRDSQQQKDLQCIFDLQTLESQLNRILQPNSTLRIQKRATSVENSSKYLKLQKIVGLKKFELKRKITTPLKSRVELKPLMLSKSRDQNKIRETGSLAISSQRDLPLDFESNPHLAHSRLTSYRSLPQSNYSSVVSSPKDIATEIHKVFESDREKNDSPSLILPINKLLDSDREKRDSPTVILPKRKKEFVPHELVFAPNVKPDIVKPHVFRIAQGIFYATQRVKPLSMTQIQSKQVELKPQGEKVKKTLVLDLDETLIFARRRDTPNEKVGLENNEPEHSPMRVKIRPHAIEFLKQMSQIFEIVIFTAAEKSYAEVMAKLLDPEQKYISHILNREHCLKTLKGLFLKDLRIIKNRDLKDIIIVDNFTPSFSFQIDNGIPIITWQGDPNDKELKYLMNYLIEANHYDDMRIYNREKLRLKELLELPPEKLNELQN